MARRQIGNISPFNSFFFVDCMYNSLFSVLRYYDLPIEPIILNTQMIFKPSTKEPFGIEYYYKELQPLWSLLDFVGLEVTKVASSHRLFSDLIDAIDLYKPIVVNVDCYYVTYRQDTFMTEHLDHNLLVIGYEGNEVIAFEHRNPNSLNYKETRFPFEEIKLANQSFNELYLNNSLFNFSYCIFDRKAKPINNRTINEAYIKMFNSGFFEVLDEMKQSHQCFIEFVAAIGRDWEQMFQEEHTFKALFDIITEIIAFKRAKADAMSLLGVEIVILMKTLNSSWADLRLSLVKMMSGLEEVKGKDIHGVIDKIIKDENHLFQKILATYAV